MRTQKAIIRIVFLIISIISCVLPQALGQSKGGLVNVTANPSVICIGESAQLHAEATTDVIIDFETGDFSQYTFVNDPTYPWAIASADNGSSYCIKSGNSGVSSSTSSIVATASFTQNGFIAFSLHSLGESTTDTYDWDVSRFYIDGEMKFQYGKHADWENYSAEVSMGTHTFKWEYKKDGTVNPTGDAFFVDNIIFSYHPMEIAEQQTFDFENHTLQGWTTIDADGDGFNWRLGTEFIFNEYGYIGFTGHNASLEIVASQSYYKESEDYGYPLYPDNYLVSPAKITVKGGAYISFWACAQDNLWAGEHFGVAVSSGNNSNPNAFTTIKQWTMTSKEAGSPAKVSRNGHRTMGSWHKYTADLSNYVGQQIWVAIRHFNCSDMFYLDVDDITIYEGSDDGPSGGDGNITYQWMPGNMTGADITVTPSQTTTYTVTAYQDGSSNPIGTASQIVVVEPVSEVGITTSTGEASICEDDSITLYASVSGTDYHLPGDILCTDGSIVHPSDWPNGKTAKAIVFYVDATGQQGWAIDLGLNVPEVTWSTLKQDVPGLQSYANYFDAIKDLDGYSNTQKIRSFNNDPLKYPAAWAVDFDQGWYLPSIGQLNILFGAFFAVKIGLETVGGTTIYEGDLWSSSANTSANSWMIRINNGYVWTEPKTGINKVRAVINF